MNQTIHFHSALELAAFLAAFLEDSTRTFEVRVLAEHSGETHYILEFTGGN